MTANSLELNNFTESLLLMVRDFFGTFGWNTNLPNVDSTVSNLGYKLRSSALAFAKSYSDTAMDKQQVLLQASEVEGYIRTSTVLGVLSEKTANNLIDELYNLVDKR